MKLFFFILLVSLKLWAGIQCVTLFDLINNKDTSKIHNKKKFEATLIEKITNQTLPKLNPEEIMLEKIKKMDESDPILAQRIRQALAAKKRGASILIDLVNLNPHMINFLNGAYRNVVGNRGLSQPFVTFEKLNEDILIIRHEGADFPLMVKWSDNVSQPQLATSFKYENKIYQMLELPMSLKGSRELIKLPYKFIYSLISSTPLNKYISWKQSDILTIASVLHEGKLEFDRPTQQEAKNVKAILDNDIGIRTKIRSLLFVAPTASGKTKVLADYLISKINSALKNLNKIENKNEINKLSILMTKTPDLTSDLALEVGKVLHEELGPSKYRIIQWGGRLSENMSHGQLIDFIRSSEVPVVLVTSYPTLGQRSKELKEKRELFENANALLIDEAHNATGEIFRSIMKAANEKADQDRLDSNRLDVFDIFGVTASPITKTQRTVEVFDAAFWAAVDKIGLWENKVRKNDINKSSVLEWVRILEQYYKARDRGEINSSDPIYFKPEEHGFKFSNIFKRGENTTHSSIHIERLKEIWPKISEMIEGHGPGIIKTYARDSIEIAKELSELSGKNFISLNGLSESARNDVYVAFRNQTEYNGRVIDAIVLSRVVEGLDFPKAGWYLSFKKNVKFPENIQDPGRVVRLSLNKLPPKIIFFGQEVDKVAYRDVRDLIMQKLGRLPRELPDGGLYSGRRNLQIRKELAKAIEELNTSMEAFLRIQGKLAHELGSSHELNTEKVKELQKILLEMRSSSQNREIADSIKNLVAQLNSYVFFNGNLKETWRLCDRLISLHKKNNQEDIDRSRLTVQEKLIIKDDNLMNQIYEFRSLFPVIGPIPRAIVENMELRPLNLSELVDSVNKFILLNQKPPFEINPDSLSLKSLVDQVIQVAPEQFWQRLSVESRQILKNTIDQNLQKTFEESLQLYFVNNNKIPQFSFEGINNPNRTAADYIGQKLAETLIQKIKEGDLKIKDLSPDLLIQLEQSDLYNGLMQKVLIAMKSLVTVDIEIKNDYLLRLKESGQLTYQNLMRSGDFRTLSVLQELANSPNSTGISAEYIRQIEEILTSIN